MRVLALALLLVFTSLFVPTVAADDPHCNDLDLSPLNVTLVEGANDRSLSFDLINDSDEQFEIDDVRVSVSHPDLAVRVVDFPDEIDDDDSERIRLEYDTEEVNNTVHTSFVLSVRGEFDNSNVDCSFSDLDFTIDVTIPNGDNICSEVEIASNNVSLSENTTVEHTIRVTNPTNQNFTIEGFSVFDDSPAFTVRLNPRFTSDEFETTIPANTTQTYTVDVIALNTSDDETDTAFIEIRGDFAGDEQCSFSDITGEFDVTVEDAGSSITTCSEIVVNAPPATIVSGETSTHAFTLQNNSSQTFYVDEYVINDTNYQVSFEPLFTPESIAFESSEELTYESTGYANAQSFDSNATLTLKGHFTNGATCTIQGRRIPFRFTGSNGGTCNEFYAGIKPITILKGTQTLRVLFQNPLNLPATVNLSVDHGNVVPSILNIPANGVQLQTLTFTNQNSNQESTLLHINTAIPGCIIPAKQSQLFFSNVQNAPVQFVNPPALLTLGSANEFALQLENNSAYTQEVTLTLIAKPGNGTYTRTVTIPGLDSPLIYLPTNVLKGKSAVIVQVKSAGYIVTHTIQLEGGNDVTITPHVSSEPVSGNTYNVDVTVTNNTNQPVEGNVNIEVPPSWRVEGNTYTTLNAYETKTIPLKVTPNTPITSTKSLMVGFEGGKHRGQATPATFTATKNPFLATGLFSGANSFWIGLLVIVLLLVGWYYVKNTPTVVVEPLNAPLLNDLDDEPWMNPPKA